MLSDEVMPVPVSGVFALVVVDVADGSKRHCHALNLQPPTPCMPPRETLVLSLSKVIVAFLSLSRSEAAMSSFWLRDWL